MSVDSATNVNLDSRATMCRNVPKPPKPVGLLREPIFLLRVSLQKTRRLALRVRGNYSRDGIILEKKRAYHQQSNWVLQHPSINRGRKAHTAWVVKRSHHRCFDRCPITLYKLDSKVPSPPFSGALIAKCCPGTNLSIAFFLRLGSHHILISRNKSHLYPRTNDPIRLQLPTSNL